MSTEVDQALINAINSALEKGDIRSTIEALGKIGKRRGMTDLANASGVTRESLYRSLSRDGNPEFATILKVVQAIGLKLTIAKT